MIRRLVVAFTAALSAAATATAAASPPVAVLTRLDNYARGEILDPGRLDMLPGSDAAAVRLVLPAGADSGWWSTPGTALLTVTSGALSVHSAAGCSLRRYEAGQTAVLPAGRHLVRNGEGTTLTLVAVFTGLRRADAVPFGAAGVGTPVHTCPQVAGHEHDRTHGTPQVEVLGRGTVAGRAAYGASAHAPHGAASTLLARRNTDLGVIHLGAAPGSSSGWGSHTPTMAIVTRGEIAYYEAGDRGCLEAGRFRSGDVYVHPGGHTHLGVIEGRDVFEGIFISVDLPTQDSPVPVFGNFLDTFDLSAMPPQGCPRL